MKIQVFKLLLHNYEKNSAGQEERNMVETFFSQMQQDGINRLEIKKDTDLQQQILAGVKAKTKTHNTNLVLWVSFMVALILGVLYYLIS